MTVKENLGKKVVAETGTYDFRLFKFDINRNLLGQSNAETVI